MAKLAAGLHAGFTEMTVGDLRAAMDADRDVVLLDVRANDRPSPCLEHAHEQQACRNAGARLRQ